MFVLRAYRLDNVPVPCEKFRFSHLPIRIGRHQLNDFSPQNGMISAFHARIEDIDGKLCIRDLGSKNGVFVALPGGAMSARLEANTSIDLAPGAFRFFLSPVVMVQLEFVKEDAPPRSSQMAGTVLGNMAMMSSQHGSEPPAPAQPAAPWGLVDPGVARQPTGTPPAAGPSGYPPAPHDPQPGAFSPTPGAPMGAGPQGPIHQSNPPVDRPIGPWAGAGSNAGIPGSPSIPAAPGASGHAPLPPNAPMPGALPALSGASPAGALPGQHPGRREQARSQAFNIQLDVLALQGLRELAESLIPGRPLETTGDVARLITKLHDTVDVFCRCFIPLREGYAQFVSSLDLQRTAAQRLANRSPSALALERATSAEAIAMALLDPRDQSFDATEAVEGIFADLMLHQVALLDGVMQGVRALLDELSPKSIEAALAQRGTAGLFASKHQARWAEFCERFERLCDERQAFAVIFGQDFAEVYRQYWHRKDGEDKGLRTGTPQR